MILIYKYLKDPSILKLTRPEGPSSIAQDFRPAYKRRRIYKP
jgi:hypothetical protein